MKWKQWIIPIVLTIIIGLFAGSMGYKKGVESCTEQSESEFWEDQNQAMTIEQYFPREELLTINAAAKRNNCKGDDLLILYAIRKAENGGKGKEFGIKDPKAWNTDLDTQAGWAAATVVKNRLRWEQAGRPKAFIDFLGDRYCPIGSADDPHGLNNNWTGNVRYWHKTFQDQKLAQAP